MKKSTTMLDFFKRKGSTSNSSEVNVELPTTNVAIPILENVDVPIPEMWMFRFQKMRMFQSLKHNFKELTLIIWIIVY